MIDPNEAPEGDVAQLGTSGCVGCKYINFHDLGFSCMHKTSPSCYSYQRSDGYSVIFVDRVIGPVMAIYATPCDDMGAHVADDEVTA